MQAFFALGILLFFFFVEILYFKLASHFNIVDKPNHRSSHTQLTIRGGGIIFPVSILLSYFFANEKYPFFLIGLWAISLVSFIDDVKPLSNKVRLLVHFAATCLVFVQMGLFDLPLYIIIFAFIFVIGTINAVNFMDGINGITGGYSLLLISTLLYIDLYKTAFIDANYLWMLFGALMVFNFFNFRYKARCFAGDVGSVSIAFIIVFYLITLIKVSGNYNYLLLLLVYGLDTFTTIVFRAIRKENIFEAHRSHYYQFLANQKHLSHVTVSMIYIVAQLFANVGFIVFFLNSSITAILFALISLILFISLRIVMEGKVRLFHPSQAC